MADEYISPKGLEWDQYESIIEEIREQPHWRKDADKCADYYDGNQLDAETLNELDAKGMAPLITNLVKPTIDLVLGMEAKTRVDWRVTADLDEYQDVAEALSQKLHEVEREARADRACSDAYASMVKTGVGWVEVSRDADPFNYPYRVSSVHRREMYWDWLAKEPDLSDARYIVRKRWLDYDLVALHFPKHKNILSASRGRWDGDWLEVAKEDVALAQAFDQERGSSIADMEWLSYNRKRICLQEVWYKAHVRGKILRLPDRAVEFDPKNEMHQIAVSQGLVNVEEAIFAQQRMSVWAGPHRLHDGKCAKKRCPYVPFFGFREDLTGAPYGLIRTMISPQDEINARRRKLMNLLSSKRVIADSDALDTRANSFSDVLEEIARPDSVVVLNPQRRNGNAFEVQTDLALSNQQFEIMKDAEMGIQSVAGVYQAMLGQSSSATSGLAINSLVEQGTTTLAELNDGYRYARTRCGEMIVDLIRDDLVGQPVQVIVGEGKRKRVIQLNTPMQHPETGEVVMMNDVAKSVTKVTLSDVPSTPAYRQQMMQQLSQVVQALPPQAQAILAPAFVELSELPDRKAIADQMRMALGIPDVDDSQEDPEKQQMMQQIQQYEQAIQQMQQAPQMLAAQAKQAEIELKQAELQMKAQSQQFSDQKTQAETQKILVDTELAGQKTALEVESAVIHNRKAMLESELESI